MILLVTNLIATMLIQADCGDHVVVTNSRYLLMTGRKTTDKVYYRHLGRPGHMRVIPLRKIVEEKVDSMSVRLTTGGGGYIATCCFWDVTQE